MPGFIGNSACNDKWGLMQHKTLYSCALFVSRWRWQVQSNNVAVGNHQLAIMYEWWMRCVANNDLTITSQWVRNNGGSNPPTADDFINAVLNGEGSSQMNKLKGW